MRKLIVLDDNMKEFYIEFIKKATKCNLKVKLKNGGKRLIIPNLDFENAKTILAQCSIELLKYNNQKEGE